MTTSALVIPGQMSFDEALSASGEPDRAGVPLSAPATCCSDPTAAQTDEPPVLERTAPAPVLPVDVIRSPRRRKTAEARLVGSTLEVRIPARCSADEERDLVEHFRTKFERAKAGEATDLVERAAELAARLSLPTPDTIRWVSNQRSRWGSCTPVDRSIRLSDRLVGFPSWVVDYVIVHELAHLVVETHSAEFWALVDAYPLTERARGYLIAKSEDG